MLWGVGCVYCRWIANKKLIETGEALAKAYREEQQHKVSEDDDDEVEEEEDYYSEGNRWLYYTMQ